jgi:hypothetical protein
MFTPPRDQDRSRWNPRHEGSTRCRSSWGLEKAVELYIAKDDLTVTPTCPSRPGCHAVSDRGCSSAEVRQASDSADSGHLSPEARLVVRAVGAAGILAGGGLLVSGLGVGVHGFEPAAVQRLDT